jgi:hypothetical protein
MARQLYVERIASFFIVIAPRLRHLWIDIQLTIECYLVLDLFRRTRSLNPHNNVTHQQRQ